MVRLLVLMLVVAFLVGCAPKPTFVKQIEIQEVEVPIIVRPPNPPISQRPILPINDIRPEDMNNPGIVVQRYKATVKVLQGYITELEVIIDGYRYAE